MAKFDDCEFPSCLGTLVLYKVLASYSSSQLRAKSGKNYRENQSQNSDNLNTAQIYPESAKRRRIRRRKHQSSERLLSYLPPSVRSRPSHSLRDPNTH